MKKEIKTYSLFKQHHERLKRFTKELEEMDERERVFLKSAHFPNRKSSKELSQQINQLEKTVKEARKKEVIAEIKKTLQGLYKRTQNKDQDLLISGPPEETT